MTVEKAKAISLKVNELFEALDTLTPEDVAAINSVATEPVGLRQTGLFNVHIDMLSKAEIKENRRALASAISAEKWFDGVKFAVTIMMMLGGI